MPVMMQPFAKSLNKPKTSCGPPDSLGNTERQNLQSYTFPSVSPTERSLTPLRASLRSLSHKSRVSGSSNDSVGNSDRLSVQSSAPPSVSPTERPLTPLKTSLRSLSHKSRMSGNSADPVGNNERLSVQSGAPPSVSPTERSLTPLRASLRSLSHGFKMSSSSVDSFGTSERQSLQSSASPSPSPTNRYSTPLKASLRSISQKSKMSSSTSVESFPAGERQCLQSCASPSSSPPKRPPTPSSRPPLCSFPPKQHSCQTVFYAQQAQQAQTPESPRRRSAQPEAPSVPAAAKPRGIHRPVTTWYPHPPPKPSAAPTSPRHASDPHPDCAPTATKPAAVAAIGEKVPQFCCDLLDNEGNLVSTFDTEKPTTPFTLVALFEIVTVRAWCRAAMARIDGLWRKYSKAGTIQFVVVICDQSVEEVVAFRASASGKCLMLPIAADPGNILATFAIEYLPRFYLLDGQHVIVEQATSLTDSLVNRVEKLADEEIISELNGYRFPLCPMAPDLCDESDAGDEEEEDEEEEEAEEEEKEEKRDEETDS